MGTRSYESSRRRERASLRGGPSPKYFGQLLLLLTKVERTKQRRFNNVAIPLRHIHTGAVTANITDSRSWQVLVPPPSHNFRDTIESSGIPSPSQPGAMQFSDDNVLRPTALSTSAVNDTLR